MGSTSFWGFPYPSLLVFLNLLFFRDMYHIFLASVGTLSGGSFLFYLYFSVHYFGLSTVTTKIRFHTTQYYCNPEL